MGYSYTMDGKLCCDHCGAAGGIRKIPCPVGYCPASALCKDCRNDPEIKRKSAEYHARVCVPGHERYMKEQEHRALILKTGAFIRTAALNHHFNDGTMVKVCFRNQERAERFYWMAPETYDAFSLMANVTPQDYAQRGQVAPAKVADLHSGE